MTFRKPNPQTLRAAPAGLVAAAAALAFGELVAGLLGVRGPVVAVGDVAIDNAPTWAKNFAIDTFGTADKPALVVGILLVLAIVSLGIGVLARRNAAAAIGGIVLICGLGAAAAIASPDPLALSLVPCLAAAVVGTVVLLAFCRTKGFTADDTSNLDRRRFLALAGGVTGFAALAMTAGRVLAGRSGAAESRANVTLPAPARPAPQIPVGTDMRVPGIDPFVTPNRDFYRIDINLVVPQVRTDGWSLKIKGMVERELSFDFDELLSRRDLTESDVTLTCVSNLVGGDLVGNARWLGVPLRNLLDEAGVDPQRATQMVGRSVDGYTCGYPTSLVYDGRTAMVAVGMNGEPLPLEHGFPARLVTAGLYGYVSATKWLEEIELTTLEGFDSYWVPRGYAKQAPIKLQSRIDTLKGFAKVGAGRNVIGGVAWAQPIGVQKVEIQIDDGPWNPARLGEEFSGSTWRQWAYEWDATPGRHNVTVRATDNKGETQTSDRSDPLPDGATGLHSVPVTVS